MSYQVLARKWRSQSFKDLVGQEHISQTLLNALKANRFPHALLFCGTRGVGKTSSARILAKTLICPNAQDFEPCNECPSCVDITSGSHMDVIEVDGASNNGVDAIRELRETVGYTPSNGKYKVYIIDEVHMLSTSAFNALLKTLEEPPAHVIFIMATTEPQKIPVTILSRCQRFDFRRISTKLIQEHILKICTSEEIPFEKEALWTIARLADGSMRDGLSLLDQAINFTNRNLTVALVSSVLGATDRSLLTQVLKSLLSRDVGLATKSIEQLLQKGIDPVVFSESLLEELRNLSIAKVLPDPSSILDFSDSEVEEIQSLSQNISSEDLHMLFDMALKGVQDLIRSQSPQIVLEMLILRMAQAPRIMDLQGFMQGSPGRSSQKKNLNSKVLQEKPLVEPQQEVTFNEPPQKLQEPVKTTPTYDKQLSLSENWAQFAKCLHILGPILSAQLEHASLESLENNTATLAVSESESFFYDQLKEPKQILKIQEAFKKVWSMDIQVQVQLSSAVTTSPKVLEKQQKAQEAEDLRKQVDAHPLIKKIKNTFDGQIINIS